MRGSSPFRTAFLSCRQGADYHECTVPCPSPGFSDAKKLATKSNVRDENRIAWNEAVVEALKDGVAYIYVNTGGAETENEEESEDHLTEDSVTEGLFH